MAERTVSPELESALWRLLDDPSPVVQAAVFEEFQRLGPTGRQVLEKFFRTAKSPLREHVEDLMTRLGGPDPSRMLMDFITGLHYELETGLYLINRVIVPDLEISGLRKELDLLANRCRELRVMPMSAREQCRIINRVLFHESSFRGNFEDFEDPLNSCLEAVCRRRKGIPVTLCCMYILIGQRLGIELEPVALPGHFLVGCFQSNRPFYIDTVERGRLRSVEEVNEFLLGIHVTPELHHLAPAPVGEVLCRVCRNLVAHFDARKQPDWAGRFRAFVRAFEETYRRRSEA